jgi:Lipopolysaccharide-assembly
MRRLALALAAVALSACGYRFASRGAPLAGGVAQIFVPPLENRTGDAEAGAFVAAALREELARRGADGGSSAAARLEGAVEDTRYAPSSPNGATWALSLTVSARLVSAGKPVAETRVARSEEYLAGQDPLETEGRRRLALRRAAAAAARDVVEQLEKP